MKKETETYKMLAYLRDYGMLLCDPGFAEKNINHQTKMVLLRKFYDWQQFGDGCFEDRFQQYWTPVRQHIEDRLFTVNP